MNSQLEHLQASIEALVGKYHAATVEKNRLAQEIAGLQETQRQLMQQHQAVVDDLNMSYHQRLVQLESEADRQIRLLQNENAAYRTLLEQSAAEIRQLLERLPVPANRQEDAA